jgi:hypothetical protein
MSVSKSSRFTRCRRIGVAAGIISTSIAASLVGFAPSANAAIGSTVAPGSVPNSATAQKLTITDSLTALYGAAPIVQLTGPGLAKAIDGTKTAGSNSTITATFDLADGGTTGGAPLGPGAYTLTVGDAVTILTSLDTIPLAITGPAPDPAGNSLAIETTGEEKTAVITSAADSTFATGDAVSFTDGTNTAVSGLTFTPSAITAKSLTGDFKASGAAVGTYNLVVTDTSGQKGICTDCVTVSAGPTAVQTLTATTTGPDTAALTWDPPADESAATFNGYDVVVSATSGASTTDSGIVVTQTAPTTDNAHPTGATVTGLTTGTTYYVSVTASDNLGTSPAATTSFASPFATSVTFDASVPQVVYGGKVTVSGLLLRTTASGDQAIGHATVYIVAKHNKSKAQVFRQLTTNGTGNFSTTFTPGKNATYAAYYGGKVSTAGHPGDVAAFSLGENINVAPKVTITSESKKSYHLGAFTLKGKVAPGARGQKVYLVLVDSLGNHKNLAYVTVGKGSTFKFHEAVLRKKGSYHVEVQIPAHGDFAAGKSKPVTLKRT